MLNWSILAIAFCIFAYSGVKGQESTTVEATSPLPSCEGTEVILQGKLGEEFDCKCIIRDIEEHERQHPHHHHHPGGPGPMEGPPPFPGRRHHHHRRNGTKDGGRKIPMVVCLPYGQYDVFAKTEESGESTTPSP